MQIKPDEITSILKERIEGVEAAMATAGGRKSRHDEQNAGI